MKFEFKARDLEGHIKEGIIEALSEQGAVEILQKNNLVPVSMEKIKKTPAFLKEISFIWEGIPSKQVAIFFNQLSTLVGAKVPILQSLSAIGEQSDNKYLRIVIREISSDIQEGVPLSEAMAKHPRVFSNLIVNIIRAGEVSGNLQQSVSFLAKSIEKSNQLKARVRGALYYPIFVMAIAGIVGFLVITFILPKLADVIREMNVAVPWYTKAVMALGYFMRDYWWVVLLTLLFFIAAFLYYLKTESGKREWDHIKIRLPIFGKIFRASFIARFSNNLAVMVKSGIPIVRALNIVSEVVDNSVYQAVILRAVDEVKGGGQISTALSHFSCFPPLVSQMTRIGEESGQLSESLNDITHFYENEVEDAARNMTALLEPILIIVLAIGVAIMVFAVLLPIYNIAGNLVG